jgi:hypothetical protein
VHFFRTFGSDEFHPDCVQMDAGFSNGSSMSLFVAVPATTRKGLTAWALPWQAVWEFLWLFTRSSVADQPPW